MSRKPKIRFKSGEKDEIRRLNKLVSNKKSRIKGKYGEVQGVETQRVDTFEHRADLKKYVKKMNEFLDRNADVEVETKKGTTIPLSGLKEVERELKRINRKKAKEYEKLKMKDFMSKGKQVTTVEAQFQLGDVRFARFKPLNFDPKRFHNVKALTEYMEKVKDEFEGDFFPKQSEVYRAKYLKGLNTVFGSLADDLKKKIEEMNLNDFMDKYYTENFASLSFVYDLAQAKAKLKTIEKVWA